MYDNDGYLLLSVGAIFETMHRYFIKTPQLVKSLFPSFVWNMDHAERSVYLSFDDGPHPEATSFVLDLLQEFNASATFFCIGKNVLAHPELYKRILNEHHAVGNHSHNHLNGWKTPVKEYIHDVSIAAQHIHSNLFRPPYGRIKMKQAAAIPAAMQQNSGRIIMWDVLSGDFDQSITPEQCTTNVTGNVGPGSIIVFHDSEKAFHNLKHSLPEVLEFLSRQEYEMKKIVL